MLLSFDAKQKLKLSVTRNKALAGETRETHPTTSPEGNVTISGSNAPATMAPCVFNN